MTVGEIILLILKASIVLSVFAIGLKATFADTTYLFRRPAQLVRAVLSMNVFMPLLAIVISLVFDLHPAVKIALVAISVSPVPPIFPNKAFKAGGTENYTIGLLAAAAVISVILIPIAMEVIERVWGIPMTMRARTVFATVLTTVLLPLLVGIGVRTLFHSLAERVAKPLAIISLVLLVVSALPVVFGLLRQVLSLIGDGTILALSAFALIGFVVGHLFGGTDPANRSVLALATATRHPAVALAIAHANFPTQKLAAPVVILYLILSAVLSGVYLAWAKRHETAHSAESKHAVKA
ncbi:MAG TPA: hypothetical protein VJS17_04785 [Pyrinomonadaceae bacterium]|nr:hypothetical protein [Pyrinomonadaceae bacterium]